MTSRRSRSFPSEPKMWVWSDQTHLLHQDFNNLIVPHRRDPEAYELSTDGIPPYQVGESLTLGERARQVDGFVRAVASGLLLNHNVWLEVVFNDGTQNRAPFAVFEVDGVGRGKMGDLVQLRPPRQELPDWFQPVDEWETEIQLDADRMVHVSLPDEYPSHLLAQVVSDLAEVGSPLPPSWVMEGFTGQRRDTPPYDVSEAVRTEHLRIAQAALPIGWTAREIFLASTRQVSDYYHYWRELRFLHFRASIRARAEGALRQVLALASTRCGFTASVTSNGVYTPDEVEGIIREFEVGEISFSDVSDLIFENSSDVHSKQRCIV